ncbi:MAG: DUF1501 domain-containing protein [Terriglobia bacterium]
MLRREFLEFGALPFLPARGGVSCILLMLTGGPSQLDTWDMKPDAPSDVRGPFRPIRTNVSGVEISEIFPRMAKHADKYALIRSVHFDGPATHAAGFQAMQTGRVFEDGAEYPHMGCVVSQATGTPHAILGGELHTGGVLPHGQSAAFPGAKSETAAGVPGNAFAKNCRQARQLVEAGARFVTVNMFDSIFDQPTWDCHGTPPFASISDYSARVGPMFDHAFSWLLEDLSGRGMLDTTLVVAMGEFGRSPRINPSGGRDHWPRCSTVLMAGGGVQGGRIYGSSDRMGAEPRDNPVTPAMLLGTIYHVLGLAVQNPLRDLLV